MKCSACGNETPQQLVSFACILCGATFSRCRYQVNEACGHRTEAHKEWEAHLKVCPGSGAKCLECEAPSNRDSIVAHCPWCRQFLYLCPAHTGFEKLEHCLGDHIQACPKKPPRPVSLAGFGFKPPFTKS